MLATRSKHCASATLEPPNLCTTHGWDAVECRIATNTGEPLQPLDEIASGGEMSRVLLALKVSVEDGATRSRARKTQVPRTLVFDEIAIGIGGRAAEAVGQKLKALSRVQQVLCVTHLPQIAAFADQHFLVEKQEKQRRTQTSVRLLTAQERAEEIARMISGATVTATSQGTGLSRDGISDDAGHYLIPLLPVGIYTLHVEFSGFQPTDTKDVRLQVDEAREVEDGGRSAEGRARNAAIDGDTLDRSRPKRQCPANPGRRGL